MKFTHMFFILTCLLLPVAEAYSFDDEAATRGTLSFDDELLPQSSWMIAIGSDQYDFMNATVEWMGALYFGGKKDYEGIVASKAWLLATDLDGNILMDRTWEDTAEGGAEIKKLVPDGDFLYAGGIIGIPFEDNDIFVLGIDTNGRILWQKQIVDDGDDVLADMILTQDGYLLLVGVNRDRGQYAGDGWVIKMDTSGNVLWQKSYGTEGFDYLRAAMDRPGGGYVVAGEISIEGSDTYFQGWMMGLDDAGDILWEKAYLISNSDGINVLVNAGNQVIGLGSASQMAYYRGDAWILRVDSSGNLVSSDMIGDFDIWQHDEFVDAIVTSGGNLITLGNTVSIGGGVYEQAWAAMINREGQLKGLRHYGGGNVDTATELLSLGADGFAFTGWTQWSPRLYDGFLVKVDKRGDGFTDCDRVHSLEGELRFQPPMVSEPPVDMRTTTAQVVDANLTEVQSETYTDFLCAD